MKSSRKKQNPKDRKALKKLANLPDDQIDFSDIPELGAEFWDNAELIYPENKIGIYIRIEPQTVAWYKRQAQDGEKYQALIRAVLNSFKASHPKGVRWDVGAVEEEG